MEHNVCKACKGTSETPGSCQKEGCEKNGQPFEACSCEDSQHGGSAEGGAMPEGGSAPEGGEGQ